MKFIKWAFLHNVWLWFHILVGGIAAKILNSFFAIRADKTILIIAAVAILYEIGELIYEWITGFKTYNCIEHFLSDAFGDILGAVIMAAIVLL
jgi:hypothetical protein